jgi:uncharacterized repeat protein (TIGR01451 family)
MRRNSLRTATVIALFVNAIGMGWVPPSAAGAPVRDYDPASVGALPAWFAAIPDDQHPVAEQETYTDSAGWYRFGGLAHGTHKVTLDPATLPLRLRPVEGEPVPALWLTPGMERISDPLSTGVRFTAAYERKNSTITGLVFVDRDGDGRPGPGEPGIPGVRVIDPTVHQYYVPFNDENLWTLFNDKNTGLPGALQCHTTGTSVAGTLNSSIFLIASSDGTVFYYDHWEDGYDPDPLVPGPTTEAGVLDAGAFQIFQDNIDPTQVPDTSVFFYDGRDRITIVGEEASVVRQAYPFRPGTLLAAAWEIPEVADWGDSFVATVGEDLDFNAGAVQDHDFTGLEVMAALPGTQVYYNGALVATLDFTDTVFIDGANDGPGGGGVDSTDTITATGPIQVQMMTGGCGDYYSAHGYTLQPVNAWCDLYLAPVPGFEPGCNPEYPTGHIWSNADTDIYLHNPHPDPITVTVSSEVVTSDIVIPPNTTMSVLYATGWPDIATGIHGTSLTSSQDFWGMAVIDSSTSGTRQSEMFDWGYALVPGSDLSSQVVVGYAPGHHTEPPDEPDDNGNLAFVAAVTDTVIYVDLNQDGLPDPIDMNGDGDRDDYDVLGVGEWDEPTSALGIEIRNRQVLRVGDPYDHNLMGAMIYTLNLEQKIAVAWGQDPCWATIADPYLDLGYTVLPFAIPRLSKTDQLAVDADLTGAVSPGDTITYTLALYNNGTGPMNDVVLTDPLPYTYTDFVVGSVQVTTPPPVGAIEYSNDGVNFGDPQGPRIQAFRITWPRIEPGQTVTSAFRVRLHTDIPVDVDEISNQAVVVSSETEPRLSEDPDDPTDPDTDTPVSRPLLSIDKRVSSSIVQPGGRITYTLLVHNYGNGVALLTAITDVLPSWVEYVPGTLDLAWPIAQVDIVTRTVTDTQSFHGHYADDFDLTPTQTTYYAGNDGSLTWPTDWTEVADDDDPLGGEVRVLTDTNALSAPAHVWMEDTDGDDAGIQRALDLSEFQAPWVRYHVSGTTSLAGDDSYTVLSGTTVLTQAVHNGEYAVREIDISAAAGSPTVTLGFLATGGLDLGEYYRFDHIAVYETEPLRVMTRTLTTESTVLSYTTSTDGNPAFYDPVTGYMVITEGMRLAADGRITATFQVQVQSPLTDGLTLANTACVTAPNWLEILSPPCDGAAVLVQSGHALTITKTAAPSPVAMGGLLTYTLHYTITGNEAVESMVVSDTTPVSTTFYAATPTATPTATLISSPTVGSRRGDVIWRVSGLWPPGSGIAQRTGTLRMVVLLDSQLLSGTLIYNAVTISDTTDLTDTDEITTPVTSAADLAIFKTDDPDPVIPGEFLTYTLEVVNNGPNEAENVVVTDTLPPEVSFVTATVPVTVALPDLVWPLGRMAFGEVRRLTVTVQVGLDVTQTFTNTASVDSTTPDPYPDNNDADEDTSPPLPGLELVKTVEPYHAARGMPFTYRLRISNTGDFPFITLRLTDTLPSADFHYVDDSGSPSEPDDIAEPDLVWFNLGPLDVDASITVSYQVTTTTAANDTYTNTATVEGVYEGGTLTDTDDAVVVIADPAVAVDKQLVKQDTDLLYPNYVTFTIAITNVGPSEIDVLPLLDTYDINYLEFTDATPYPEEDADDGLLTWNDLTGPAPYGFGRNLPPGQAFAVTTVFLIVRDVFATTNTATVTGATDIYGNPADEVQDDVTIRDAPTPIELLYFQAVAEEAAVRLEWATAAEVDCLGFYLYRAPDAHFSHAEAIAYHAAQGGNSTYSHVDRDTTPGQVYWYWLVEVNTDGPDLERPYGPVWGGVELDALPFRVYLPLIQRSW